MCALQMTKADLFGQYRHYVFEDDDGDFEVTCFERKCESDGRKNIRSARKMIDRFESVDLPNVVKSVLAGITGTPELKYNAGQVCSMYMFGEEVAGFFEPSASEFSNGNLTVADIDGNGTADGLLIAMPDGMPVAVATYNLETMSKKPYAQFMCAEPDIYRRGVEAYLMPFDRFFKPTIPGVINTLILMLNIEPVVARYFADHKPQIESASNEYQSKD